MAAINRVRMLALALVAAAGPLAAQAPPPAGAAPAPGAIPGAVAEPKLVFDREVYGYNGNARRDPFKPLIGKESSGPLFDDLKLKGIIYSTDPTRSIVLIEDGSKRLYRIKRGDVIGNSRVVEIRPLAARFAVENFGMIRYEVLEVRRGAAEAAGLQGGTQPVPANAPMPQGQRSTDEAARRMLDSLTNARRDSLARTNSNDEPEARR